MEHGVGMVGVTALGSSNCRWIDVMVVQVVGVEHGEYAGTGGT